MERSVWRLERDVGVESESVERGVEGESGELR